MSDPTAPQPPPEQPGQYQQPPQQPPQYQQAATPQQRYTTMGIVSLIFGIVQFFALPVIGAIVAVITGYMSRNEAEQNPHLSDDLGRIGRILGWVGLALTAAGILLLVLFLGGLGVFGVLLG